MQEKENVLANTVSTIDPEEPAISALNQELGVAGTLRFLALIHQSPTDYMEISCHLYEGQSLDDIFARAKENWQG
jgi:hypothetical protein